MWFEFDYINKIYIIKNNDIILWDFESLWGKKLYDQSKVKCLQFYIYSNIEFNNYDIYY